MYFTIQHFPLRNFIHNKSSITIKNVKKDEYLGGLGDLSLQEIADGDTDYVHSLTQCLSHKQKLEDVNFSGPDRISTETEMPSFISHRQTIVSEKKVWVLTINQFYTICNYSK
jgi:hypothetical protein